MPKYPSLYQVNTRVWLTELSQQLGRKATLNDIPDAEIDKIAKLGIDWVWFLSVWTTGDAAKTVSRENPQWSREFEVTLGDLTEEDIGGSGFAIVDYRVHPSLGGEVALKHLRSKLKKRGLKLMLDFVPNHMAPDHGWVKSHPDYFISGTEELLEQNPQNYARIKRKKDDFILAYGRDPFFSGWPDTVQLDYSKRATVGAMTEELLRISGQCDGLRCDMAMLVLPEVFERTWGRKALPFWPEAIKLVREKLPDFCFLAEVYWDMEWELQQLGFDYTYDKRLYDRLVEGYAKPIREHFYAGLDYQDKLARFLENHDEARAAKTFGLEQHKAAAIITYLSPGLRFFHQGQFEGRVKHISPHLIRAPKEVLNSEIQLFYSKLLNILSKPIFRDGRWLLLKCIPAWENNNSFDSIIAFAWDGIGHERAIIAVNYSPHQSQCLVLLPFDEIGVQIVKLTDLMSEDVYQLQANELITKGLFINLPAWGYHIFALNK